MTAIFIGLVFVVSGVWGIVHYFHSFLLVLKGILPLSFLLGGILSIIAGFSSLQPSSKDKNKKD